MLSSPTAPSLSSSHTQTLQSYPPIRITREKCANVASITDIKSSFCARHGVASVLPLDRLQWDTFVSHEERLRLEQTERSEEEGRSTVRLEEGAVTRSFEQTSLSLKKMHEERVLSHLQFSLDESADRSVVEEVEEAKRVPLSHAHTAGLFGPLYLEQILKRGAIVEDDMKRERKFTGVNERNERIRLIQSFVSALAATAARENANIEHLSMRAESFVTAAKRFHTLYHGSGESAGSPLRVVMERRYNTSGKAGHLSLMPKKAAIETATVRKIQKSLSADPTQFSHSRLLKSLLHYKEYVEELKPKRQTDYAVTPSGDEVATPSADMQGLVLAVKFVSGETIRVCVGGHNDSPLVDQFPLPPREIRDGTQGAEAASQMSESLLFSPQKLASLFDSIAGLCAGITNELAKGVLDVCTSVGEDSVFDRFTETVADVVAKDLQLVSGLIIPTPKGQSPSSSFAFSLGDLPARIDELQASLDVAPCFDSEMIALSKVLHPILKGLSSGVSTNKVAYVALLLLDAIVARCLGALQGLAQQLIEGSTSCGVVTDIDRLTAQIAVFSESCLWMSGTFLVASRVFPLIKSLGGSRTDASTQFAAAFLKECAKRAVILAHAWSHEWSHGLGHRLGILRRVGAVEHPSYPNNVRLLASHWVRVRVAKQRQEYKVAKKERALQERLATKRAVLSSRNRAKREVGDVTGSSLSNSNPIRPPAAKSLSGTNDQLMEFSNLIDASILEMFPLDDRQVPLLEVAIDAAVEVVCCADSLRRGAVFTPSGLVCPDVKSYHVISTYVHIPTSAV